MTFVSALRRDPIWLVLPPLVFLLLVLRSILFEAPLFGNDDLLYYLEGKYFPQQAALAPYDPKTFGFKHNALFFAFVRMWHGIGGANAYLVGRLFQDAVFLIGGGLVFVLARGAFGQRAARAATLVYFVLPMSIYTVALTPDMASATMFYLLALTFGSSWSRRPFATAVAAGLILAAAHLIKPVALGSVAAVFVVMAVSPFMPFAPSLGWRTALGSMIAFGFALVAGLALFSIMAPQPWPLLSLVLGATGLLIWALLVSSWPAAIAASFPQQWRAVLGAGSLLTALALLWIAGGPRLRLDRLIGNIYANNIATAFSLSFWAGHISATIRYFAANIVALAAVSPSGLVLLSGGLWHALRRGRTGDAEADSRLPLLLFLGCAVIFSVLVTALAATIYSADAFEANRFQARYHIFLVPVLAAVLFGLGRDASPRMARICAVFGMGAACALFYLASDGFNIFAPDFPEAYAFFTVPNHLHWDYPKPWPSVLDHGGHIVVGAAIFAGVAVLMRPRWFVPIFGALLLLTSTVGQFEVYAYFSDQSRIIASRVADGRTIAHLLAPVEAGKGVIVAERRYEFAPDFEFALRAPQWVLVRPAGSRLREVDLPRGAAWVAAIDEYIADFPYAYSLKLAHTTLYVTDPRALAVRESPKPIWSGSEPLRLNLAAGADSGLAEGFNAPEAWGAWSAADVAVVRLPALVSGSLILRITAGTVPENLQEPLRVELGDARAETVLGTNVEPHEVGLAPSEPTDTLSLEIPTRKRLTGDLRRLGVAVGRVEIARQGAPASE